MKHLALLVENREVVGKIVEDLVDDPRKTLIKGIFLSHRRRPAKSGVCQFVDQQPRRMGLLRKEGAIKHRSLQDRDLQSGEQCLDAIGKIAGFEDEVEQHRDHLDGHRLDLVRLGTQRGFLQVPQDVVQTLRNAREGNGRTTNIEIGVAGLQARQPLVQIGGGNDWCTGHVTRRRHRHRREDPRCHPRHVDCRQLAVAHHRGLPGTNAPAMRGGRRRLGGRCRTAIHPLEHRHHIDFRRRCSLLCGLGCSALRCAICGRATIDHMVFAEPGHDIQFEQMQIEIPVNQRDPTQWRLIQVLHDLELDPAFSLQRLDGM